MAFEFDYSDVPENVEDLQKSSGRAKPGRGMVVIKEWSEYSANSGKQHELTMEIVAWSNPESLAVIHTERIWHADHAGDNDEGKRNKKNFSDIMMAIAVASGIISARDIATCREKKLPIKFDIEKAIERPVMIELEERPDKKNTIKSYINVALYGKAFFHIKDPRVKDWPVNQSIYNRCAATVGEWITETKAAAPKKDAAAGVTADPFAGVV